mmetsp:Transcript_4555/g.18270  ORF Transcript_4555/g.18270 Transcript_4555/m.18270 type:complete len:484 (+) Transcript_4555:886-2337(+)
MEAQRIEEHFARAAPHVRALVLHELAQPREQREPKVRVALRELLLLLLLLLLPLRLLLLLLPAGLGACRRTAATVCAAHVAATGGLVRAGQALRELQGTEAQECDGVEAHLGRERRVGERDETVDAIRERGGLRLGDVPEALAHDSLDRLEGQLDDRTILVGRRRGEHHEHALPARAHVVHARLDHLAEATDDELPYLWTARPPHDDHEGLQEVVLEGEHCHLVLLQELHAQLAQRVDRVHGHLQVLVAADRHKVLRQHAPYAAPHQPDARADVEIRNLHHLLQAEDARPRGVAELLEGDLAEGIHEVHHGIAVEPRAADENPVEGVSLEPRQDTAQARRPSSILYRAQLAVAHGRASPAAQAAEASAALARRHRAALSRAEEARVCHGAVRHHEQVCKPAHALQHLRPRAAQVVSVLLDDLKHGANSVHVVHIHVRRLVQVGELGERGDEGIPHGLHPQHSGHAHRRARALQEKLWIVARRS